jgi:endogenous inhibitor of DNA gyrase (YacG/DUF329 family)
MPDHPLCAYCRQRPVETRFRPFCSERCKLADLGHWLTGRYRIAGAPDDREASSDDEDRPDTDRR